MRSNWKIPKGRITRSASFSGVNTVTPSIKEQNGYHSNGWYPSTPSGSDTIFEESQTSTDTEHSPSHHKLRRSSYAGTDFHSEPKPRRRPTYKRLRSRKQAVQRIHPGISPYAPPCEVVEQVIDYHSEDAIDTSSSIMSRMVPMVMTWYMTLTEELYNGFKGGSTTHRFWMWLLACLLSTFMTLALLVFFAFVLLYSMDILVILLAASVKFAVFVISASFICCCAVLILNYRGK